jgi:hypothetical protein
VDADLLFREQHGDTERRACATLARATVTGNDKDRFARGIGAQRAATATGRSHYGDLLVCGVIPWIFVQ